MDEFEVLDQLDKLTIFDDQSKALAERIVLQMFQTVRAKVPEPKLNHFASFIVSYIKKQQSVVVFAIARVVLARGGTTVQVQAMQELLTTLKQNCEKMSAAEIDAGYTLANELIQILIEKNAL